MAQSRWWYWLALALIVVLAGSLRIGTTDLTRQIVDGDETIYWYSAGDLIEHGTLTREIDGAMYRGEAPMEPTSRLSPGYPLFIAAVRAMGGGVSTVLASNIVLGMVSLLLVLLIMRELGLGRWATVLAFLLAATYPGFIYNLDRMLTEQLYVALFTGFVFAAVRGMRTDAVAWTAVAAALLTLAVHVRAQALPFALLAAVFMHATLRRERASRHLLALAIVMLALMAPWWIRNALTFGRLILLTEAGEGAAVWGAVPYFIDMGSARGDLVDVVARNLPPAPDVYWRWRVFGFLHYMWGDIWDERLVHPVLSLRKLLLLHPFAVVLPLVAAPLLALRRQPLVLFVACIPMAVTLMAAPYHGLPRYAFPAVPFAFVILAALLSTPRAPTLAAGPLASWQHQLGRWLGRGFLAASLLFSALLVYALVFFGPRIGLEQSGYRLARYMGTRIDQLGSPVQVTRIDLRPVPVENTSVIRPGRVVNDVDAPAVIKLQVPRLQDSARVVTEVRLAMHGGFHYDYTTVYWTGARTPAISENAVYKFPNHAWRDGVTVYIDDDVDHLMIVPFVFRWGKMELDSAVVKKYRVPPPSSSP
ncbi:MAG: glycosyltransferase family 39 protein [Pseudomonadota bacterium]|nr:glycosyltransferase family 39 protein [Pseudomonadota bacterium]